VTRITRTYRWDMGHRLQHHTGLCRNPHGHSYTAEVTIAGPVKNAGPEAGMVADFSNLDGTLRETIGGWDHAFMLQSGDPLLFAMEHAGAGESWRLVEVPWPPTAERIAGEIARRLGVLWTERKVVSVRVWETPRSCAEWRAQDPTPADAGSDL
jgi:6-pyruvoyltetrahydropterin/6-carboxytetrahydropterin synthase